MKNDGGYEIYGYGSIHTLDMNRFYIHIPLFWENREAILRDPRYYSIVAPDHLYATFGATDKITLGELLQIWENETEYSCKCSACKGLFHKCGGKAVVYYFAGSPLSGKIFASENICVECGRFGKGTGAISFGKLVTARHKYAPIEPMAETPALLDELVAKCLSLRSIKETFSATERIQRQF
jgi:hypothetical protein